MDHFFPTFLKYSTHSGWYKLICEQAVALNGHSAENSEHQFGTSQENLMQSLHFLPRLAQWHRQTPVE
jgi:hypothetical protein